LNEPSGRLRTYNGVVSIVDSTTITR